MGARPPNVTRKALRCYHPFVPNVTICYQNTLGTNRAYVTMLPLQRRFICSR